MFNTIEYVFSCSNFSLSLLCDFGLCCNVQFNLSQCSNGAAAVAVVVLFYVVRVFVCVFTSSIDTLLRVTKHNDTHLSYRSQLGSRELWAINKTHTHKNDMKRREKWQNRDIMMVSHY